MNVIPKGLNSLRKAVRFLARYPRLMAFSIGLLLVNISIELYLPQIIGDCITALRFHAERSLPFDYRPFVYLYGSLVLIRAGVGYILGPIRNRAMQGSLADLRTALFDVIQNLGFGFHDRSSAGELISRSTTDVGRLQEFFLACLLLTIDIFVSLLMVLILVFLVHPLLGVMTLFTMFPTIGLIIRFARRLQPQWRKVHDAHGAMTTLIQENIAGVRVVKAFGQEKVEVEKFQKQRDRYLIRYLETINYWASRVPLAQFIFGLSVPAVLAVGGYLIIHQNLPLGDLAKVLFYLMAVGTRMAMVGQFTNIIQTASASAERVFEIMESGEKLADGTELLKPGPGEVRFRNVSFSYHQPLATLTNISFVAPARHTVAIAGATGSGKSTLVHLIPRFYDPDAGDVFIDGQNLRETRLTELRRNVGVIFQETFLFSSSVAGNIRYGRPEASMEEVRKAAIAAQADEFIRLLPKGYDTILGERGISLSGGQKQRLAIARAFLLDPRILIFDDATASVDSRTEHLIQTAMRELCRNRTTFVIAHRLSTLALADRVLLLDQGRMVQFGTMEEVKTDPKFQELFGSAGNLKT